MKRSLFILFFFAIAIKGFCQYDTTAPCLKTKTLPTFSLLSIDSVVFSQNILDTGKQTILMLFNPECEHCQKETERFLSMPEIFKKAQLVMISMESLEKTKLFSQRYQLEKNPCIYIGKDFKRFFIGYFMAQTIPVLAFYDQKKSLLFYKQGDVTEKEIQEKIK